MPVLLYKTQLVHTKLPVSITEKMNALRQEKMKIFLLILISRGHVVPTINFCMQDSLLWLSH